MQPVVSITETISRRSPEKNVVRLIQEWLNLHGYRINIDGDFGPATEAATREFQARAGLRVSGQVDGLTFSSLTAPIQYAVARADVQTDDVHELVIAYAKRHLTAQAREVGGPNRGPWVRLYMDGHEGEAALWCCGFVRFCIDQAFAHLRQTAPMLKTFSCDRLAEWSGEKGLLVRGELGDQRVVRPGHLFLVRKTTSDWTHTGIVTQLFSEYCETIEGNTNDEGSRNGFEVCARKRGYGRLDFIAWKA
jgi:hypothetical protein